MAFVFTSSDVKRIGKVLGIAPKRIGNNFRFEINQENDIRRVALEIYPNIRIGSKRGNLVSVYTTNAHLQLHFCSGYVLSEMLGEVTFIGKNDEKLSGLIVEKGGGCSLYANVERDILSGDFTQLGPEVMLSGIALSLTESVLPKKSAKKKKARK
ncbi:MAG TPA: hypothetical protein VKS81_11000 [Bacteroidota bacterium]|nr:hypothetical protein [Bacteroidota bacterium]